MAVSKFTADREEAAAARAIQLGYIVSRYLGPDEFLYMLQPGSGLTLHQLEGLLNMLESSSSGSGLEEGADLEDVLTALYSIDALGQALQLDPGHRFDRTAVAGLIEREARRAAGTIDARLTALHAPIKGS